MSGAQDKALADKATIDAASFITGATVPVDGGYLAVKTF